MEKKTLRSFFIVVGILLMVSIVLAVSMSDYSFSHIVDSLTTEDNVYLIDEKDNKISIIKSDYENKIVSKISFSKIEKGKITVFSDLFYDNDNVYTYKIVKEALSNKIVSEQLYLCNFKMHKLEKQLELSTSFEYEQTNYPINVKDGQLYFVNIKQNQQEFKAVAELNRSDMSGNAQKIGEVNYDIDKGFSSFFAFDENFGFLSPDGKIFLAKEVISHNNITKDTNNSSVDNSSIKTITESQTVYASKDTPAVKKDNFVKSIAKEIVSSQYKPVKTVSDGKDKILFIDSKSGNILSSQLNAADKPKNLKELNGFIYDNSLRCDDISNLFLRENGDICAVISKDGGRNQLLISHLQQNRIVDKLDEKGVDTFLRSLFIFAVLLLISLLCYVLVTLIFVVNKGKFPIVVKLVVTCVPIAILSVISLQYMITDIFRQQGIENQVKELFLISRQQMEGISSKRLSQIDIENPYESAYFFEVKQVINSLPRESTVYYGKEQKENKLYDFGYHWLYKVEDKRLKSLCCDNLPVDVPMEYFYDRTTSKMFYDCMKEDRVISSQIKDEGGEWIITAIPIKDENNNVVAVMETGTTIESLKYRITLGEKKINTVNFLILTVLIACLSALIIFCLYPLKSLRTAVDSITNGDLTSRTKVRGNDEIADIGRAFNQMSGSVEYSVNELTDLNKGYYRFVPSKIFTMLRKSSVKDVNLGDQIKSDISVLSVNACNFDKIVRSMTSGEIFGFVNSVFSKFVPLVIKNKGVVNKFENAGFLAFYTATSENALITAVSVCEEMKKENTPGEFTCGISYGPVMLGIVGNEDRFEASAISEHTNLSHFLQGIAPKYSSKILITQSCADTIADFENRFNSRWLGMMEITASSSTEKLIDVFDGDDDVMKQLKKNTKQLFEKGVSLYCQNNFVEARLVFIEVLKKNRGDYAAKEYLYRCDKYCNLDKNREAEAFIERY